MSEMIERVARAIAPAAFANSYSSKKAQGAEQARARTQARAAIEAMRPETDDSIDKFIICQWIDAALSQSGEG